MKISKSTVDITRPIIAPQIPAAIGTARSVGRKTAYIYSENLLKLSTQIESLTVFRRNFIISDSHLAILFCDNSTLQSFVVFYDIASFQLTQHDLGMSISILVPYCDMNVTRCPVNRNIQLKIQSSIVWYCMKIH